MIKKFNTHSGEYFSISFNEKERAYMFKIDYINFFYLYPVIRKRGGGYSYSIRNRFYGDYKFIENQKVILISSTFRRIG